MRAIDVSEDAHRYEWMQAYGKLSSLLPGFVKGTEVKVYLLGFVFACHLMQSGKQKEYKEELSKAHNDTIHFRHRATHVSEQSQRCNMEHLNETLVQWLFCRLPWEYNLKYPECVPHQESPVMEDTPSMLSKNFPHQDIPCGITNFLKYVASIKFESAPDYKRLKRICEKGVHLRDFRPKSRMPFNTPKKRRVATRSRQRSPCCEKS
ncbi:hypothetical protein MRX96_000400 [Rhipicephalus microplus]|uniref:Uncharacterized protein n=1 Tax=Rhipicephalus microplus TaxID=6941 RepID=A0A9J6EH66_RHIMP|nr:hypothetical protein HPB51_011428 [Rhipicephalus microplus]